MNHHVLFPFCPSFHRAWLIAIGWCLTGMVAAAQVAPPVGPPPVGQAPVWQAVVGDALAGKDSAIQQLNTIARQLDDADARSALDRIRAAGHRRHSALAALFLDHEEPWVRQMAVSAIGRLGLDSVSTLDLLLKRLTDPAPIVRQAAGTALGNLRDPRSWPPLIAMLGDDDPDLVRLAHESLRTQCNQPFPPDAKVWNQWYQEQLVRDEEQLSGYQQELAAPEGNSAAAIDGLAGLRLVRGQAVSVLLTLVDHPNEAVRAQVERQLREWTGTLGSEAMAVCVSRAQAEAQPVSPPPAGAVTPASPPQARVGTPVAPMAVVAPTPPAKGLLDTNMGLLYVITGLAAVLGVMLWFLRTPAGQAVKVATGRFVRKTGAHKVVVMVEEGTRRLVKPVPKPIRDAVRRASTEIGQAVRKADEATRRFGRGGKKAATSAAASSAALEHKQTAAPEAHSGSAP